MMGPRRRIVMTAVLTFLFFSICLPVVFADDVSSGANLWFTHYVGPNQSCYCEFWEPGTSNTISTKELTSGTYVFATLAISFNTTIEEGVDLSVAFTDLKNSSGDCLPYTMKILEPDSEDEMVEVEADGENGAGSAVLYTDHPLIKTDQFLAWNTYEVADFQISVDLDGDNAPPGDFTATITFTLEGP